LRWLALVGVAVVVLPQAAGLLDLRPRQGWGFLLLFLIVPVVAVAIARLTPGAAGRLRRHPDLLVPLGVLVFLDAILGWLQRAPALARLLTAAYPMNLFGIGLSLSAAYGLSILLRVAYAAWMTSLILDVVRTGRADPIAALAGLRRWFWRVLGLESVGWVVLLAGAAVALALAPVSLVVTVLVMAAWALFWNLATAALLPNGLDGGVNFWGALAGGIRVSWGGQRRWRLAVVAQLLLLGLATFYSLSYSEARPGSSTTYSRTNWSVNPFWTGGYEDGCRWYGKLMETLEVPPVPLVVTALALVFGVLAVAVKLHVAAALAAPAAPASAPGAPTEGLPEHPAVSSVPGDERARSHFQAAEGTAAEPNDDPFRRREER
jgi:hypothetical protein